MFKVSQKLKIISGIAIVAVGIICLACASMKSSAKENISHNAIDIAKWHVQAPTLFNNNGYKALLESNSNDGGINNHTHSTTYIGEVTNPFGIRDDVLYFIINYFPKNESAIYAAIRMEQDNTMIYKSIKESDIIQYANSPAVWCLGNIVGAVNLSKYVENVDNLKLSTNEGKMVDNVIRKKLGWKIFGFGHKTNQQLDTICEKGNY